MEHARTTWQIGIYALISLLIVGFSNLSDIELVSMRSIATKNVAIDTIRRWREKRPE